MLNSPNIEQPTETELLREQVEKLSRQLRESELLASKWREIAEHAPGFIYKIDHEFRLVNLNKVGVNYTMEETIGKPFSEMTHPDDWPYVKQLLNKVFESGETVTYEAKEVLTGSWYESTIAPQIEDGKIKHAIGVTQNVDARKKQEKALHASEARLKVMVNQVPAVLWTTDLDMVITTSEGAGLESLNLKPGQLVGRTLAEAVGAENEIHPAILATQKALQGESATYESKYQGVFFETRIEPLRDEQGTIIGSIGFSLDISQRKQNDQELEEANLEIIQQRDSLEITVQERTLELEEANLKLKVDLKRRIEVEQALRESEERFRVIAEASPVPIVITQLSDGKMAYGNDSFIEVFRFQPEEIQSIISPNYYHDLSDRERLLDQLKVSGKIQGTEVQFYRGDHSLFWVAVYVQKIRYQNEDALLSCFLDITERKESEQKLEQERKLLSRLLELNDRDRQLIAYEIHDGIVQDMSGSLMFAESGLRQCSEGDMEGIEDLEKGTRLLRTCISEARLIIDGLRPPVLEEAGVVAAIDNLVEEMSYTSPVQIAFEHNISFHRIAPTLEMAIYRIVQESLNNVSQHSESKSAQVKLLQQESMIAIEIIDQGTGFDPAVVKKRRYGLEGIKERARLLEGLSSIESTLGKGTRIYVELPLTDTLLPRPYDS